MIVLTAGSRRLIEAAIDRLPDVRQRQEWRAWANANPDRQAGVTMPPDIIAIAVLALEKKYDDLLHQRDYAEEDDRFYFDNDLTFISSIKKGLVAEAV